MSKRILIVAGGTGGHVMPGLAVANQLRAQGHEVFWIGTQKGIEARVVPAADIPIHYIDITGIRGKKLVTLIKAPWLILKAFCQAYSIIKTLKVDAVLCMGGFVSGPSGLAAKALGKPLLIHEQNAIAGTTNKLLSKVATQILTAFPNVFAKGKVVGNPVRVFIQQGEAKGLKEAGRLNLLVLGGSLGAQAINKLIPELIDARGENLSVQHQVGPKLYDDTISLYKGLLPNPHIEVNAFIEDMGSAYQKADVVICRSGAMTVSEIACAGLPALFIPFPYAIDDHQTANANWLVDAGAAELVQQAALTLDKLIAFIDKAVAEPHYLQEMAEAAKHQAKPNATESVVQSCLEVAL